MPSRADPVDAYLASVPESRRPLVEALVDTVRRNVPAGYEEGIQYGMIGWYVPLDRYPDTYNGQPLNYAALANQKNYVSLYLMGCYADPVATARLQRGFAEAGSKPNMGKSCVRFRKMGDVPWDAIAEAVGWMGVDDFVAYYEASRD